MRCCSGSNRPKRVTDPAGRLTTFSYGAVGFGETRLIKITDPVGRVCTLGYDQYGNVAKLVSPAAEVTTVVNYAGPPQILA